MAAERLSVRKIREVLRLAAKGHTQRQIGRSLSISHNTAAGYLRRAAAAGIDAAAAEALDDLALTQRLFPPAAPASVSRPMPEWAEIGRELKRKGVTLQLLWVEYKADHPDGYEYTQFVKHFRDWQGGVDVVLRHEHKAGERAFVDYAGQTIPYVDRETGEVFEAEIFVGTLGASNHTFVEATESQSLRDWIGSHVHMYAYFDGVPEITVPDNLKAGVRQPCFYEPDVNSTYHEMAVHYGTTVLPARVRKPRDKAKVETSVQIVERLILAPLRNHTFFSVAEINAAIVPLREELADRPFQKLEGCRRTLFEALDRPALLPLPATPYAFAEWRKARVNIDYHVEVKRHYYSVPYTLARQPVEVRLSSNGVEIFHSGRRVAAHIRNSRVGGYSTLPGHRPKAHQKHLEWSPSRLIRWGEEIGVSTGALVAKILDSRPHPEQGYRACLGLMRLAKRYTPERLEASCFRALRSGAHSYRSVKSILEHGLDRVPLEEQAELSLPTDHENVRGAAYFNS
ncbi:MAG: IS21 family transposase [Actinomycetota bacterium]